MKLSAKGLALVPAVKHIGQELVLLSLLALLALVGAGVAGSHLASGPAGAQIAASVGDVHIGSQAATNGTIHVGG